jgi:hemerythrin-like domain-containing protein
VAQLAANGLLTLLYAARDTAQNEADIIARASAVNSAHEQHSDCCDRLARRGTRIMQTRDSLRAGHDGVRLVLDQLERAVTAAEAEAAIPAAMLCNIGVFFRVFNDRCHHRKEETTVLPVLSAAGEPLVAQLEQEHAQGRSLAQAYAAAVEGYQPSDRGTVHDVTAAARAYAALLRTHIARETAALLPLLHETLSQDRDAALAQAFEEIEERRIGPGTHERLHQMIASLGPWITAAGGL